VAGACYLIAVLHALVGRWPEREPATPRPAAVPAAPAPAKAP
jgi:hypothetical protein